MASVAHAYVFSMGSLHVILGDLLRLQCDALIVGGAPDRVGNVWVRSDISPELRKAFAPARMSEPFQFCDVESKRQMSMPSARTLKDAPTQAAHWIRAASDRLRRSGFTRRPLLAAPVLSASQFADNKFALALQLCDALETAASDLDVDVAHVLPPTAAHRPMYAAIQRQRRGRQTLLPADAEAARLRFKYLGGLRPLPAELAGCGKRQLLGAPPRRRISLSSSR